VAALDRGEKDQECRYRDGGPGHQSATRRDQAAAAEREGRQPKDEKRHADHVCREFRRRRTQVGPGKKLKYVLGLERNDSTSEEGEKVERERARRKHAERTRGPSAVEDGAHIVEIIMKIMLGDHRCQEDAELEERDEG